MIPWIYERLTATVSPEDAVQLDGSMFRHRLHHPVYGLVVLLQELSLDSFEYVATEGPQATVYNETGRGFYLLRKGRKVSFASFRIAGRDNIVTAGLRYRDPLDPSSGLRDKHQVPIIGGWLGVADLLASAVRHSPHWKDLETIETSVERIDDWRKQSFEGVAETWHHTYEVWVTPTYDWCAAWNHGKLGGMRWSSGAAHFDRNRSVLVAKVTVECASSGGVVYETVRNIDLYPELSEQIWDLENSLNREDDFDHYEADHACLFDDNHALRYCWDGCYRMRKLDPPVYLEFEERVLRFPPHSEVRVNWVGTKA